MCRFFYASALTNHRHVFSGKFLNFCEPLELKGRRLDGNVETFRPSKSQFRAHEYEQLLLFLPKSNSGPMNDNIDWVNIGLGMTYQYKNYLKNQTQNVIHKLL